MHLTTQAHFDNAWKFGGIRHFAISNYYPSAPTYPLNDPQYPAVFQNIPHGAIGMPNAEHHSFTDERIGHAHILALGSSIASGKPKGEEPIGYNGTIKAFCEEVKANFIYKNGGGAVIAHPKWSGFTTQDLIELLDAHDVILGFEVFNSNSADIYKYAYPRTLPSFDQWNEILASGRRAFGFFVPDHDYQRDMIKDNPGKNVLFVGSDEYDEEGCAKAYVNGAFYGIMEHTYLTFARIEAAPTELFVELNEPADIKFIYEKGVFASIENSTKLATTWYSSETPKFLRIEAQNAGGKIFSQGIQYTSKV